MRSVVERSNRQLTNPTERPRAGSRHSLAGNRTTHNSLIIASFILLSGSFPKQLSKRCEFGLGQQDNVYTIYTGDDTMDEDAFGVFRTSQHRKGAYFTLQNTNEVRQFLNKLITHTDTKEIHAAA